MPRLILAVPCKQMRCFMFVPGFIETVTTEAWRPGEAKPTFILMMLGAPKPRDVAIFAQALQPGQTLRAVGDSPAMQLALEAFCSTHGLTVVNNSWEQDLTLTGCYTHYY